MTGVTFSLKHHMWDEMESVIIEAPDLHCPFKRYTQKKVLPIRLSPDIIEIIHNRDRLYKVAKTTNSREDWANARKASNLCNKL